MLKITDNIKLGKLVGSLGSTESGGSGGSSNYNDLTNKPSINGVSLTSNKTSADLGVLDLKATDTQKMNGALMITDSIVIVDYENTPKFAIAYNSTGSFDGGEVIGLAGITELIIDSKKIINMHTPIIKYPDNFEDLEDNAILTKAQVQEMINNALNNS